MVAAGGVSWATEKGDGGGDCGWGAASCLGASKGFAGRNSEVAGASKPNSFGSEIWKGLSLVLRGSGRRTAFSESVVDSFSRTMAKGEGALASGVAGVGAAENGLGAEEAGASSATAKGEGGGPPGEDWFANVSKIPRVLLMVGKGVVWGGGLSGRPMGLKFKKPKVSSA